MQLVNPVTHIVKNYSSNGRVKVGGSNGIPKAKPGRGGLGEAMVLALQAKGVVVNAPVPQQTFTTDEIVAGALSSLLK